MSQPVVIEAAITPLRRGVPARSVDAMVLPGTPAALDIYRSMMEGSSLPWTVSLFGDPVLESPLARHALEHGGHFRVGIEDAAGMTDLSNVELVDAAVALAAEVGRPIATGAAARAALAST